jgi:RNA polymerase sigma factor (TIGR02999 family)
MEIVTRILNRLEAGDRQAAAELLPLVYDELRSLAERALGRERPGQTLQATALVHEAYLRLVGEEATSPEWEGRRHFFGAAAEAMRRILVEAARRKGRVKHGGELERREWDESLVAACEPREDLVALDEALVRLAEHDPDGARLVELRYFAGLTLPEAAEVLGVSARTADRLWSYAKAWLHREMTR